MSVLSLPRLYFRGQMYCDPSTPNNYSDLYDKTTNTAKTDGMTDDEFKQKVIRDSGWNLYGFHRCRFQSTRIVGGTLSDGTVASDPLIGSSVQILGDTTRGGRSSDPVIVDVDPYSVWSSQIFWHQLVIESTQVGITGSRSPQRQMCSYGINFRRNFNLAASSGASAVFQTSISSDRLQFNGEERSPLLQALQEAIQQDDAQGLMIRFCAYRTLFYQNGILNDTPQQPRSQEELRRLYSEGQIFSNPVYSLIVGSIGVWKKGEPAIAPAGRYLTSKNEVICVGGSRTIPLGPVVAEVNQLNQGPTLSLDLSNTFPEWDASATKADFGSVTVGVENKGEFTEISTLEYSQYNQQAYESKGGIVDIPLNNDQVQLLEEGKLAFHVHTTGQPVTALEEEVYTAVSDNRAFYLEEDDTKELTIQVLYKGKPAPARTNLLLAQYDHGRSLISDPNNLLVNINTETVVKTDGQGIVTLTVNPIQPGCCNIGLIPFGENEPQPQPDGTLNTTFSHYLCGRVMPFDNALSGTPDNELTWEFMYEKIFRVYHLIYPGMSRIIPMNNRQVMERAVGSIRGIVGQDTEDNGAIRNFMWDNTMYMAITRDLSFGKRELVRRWCDLVERGQQPQ